MKTAEQWVKQYNKMLPENYGLTQTLIEEIQLQAIKEGMRRGAIMAEHWNGAVSIDNIILTAAEQLTEKDL
jgi:hypothetical protein